jgi:hypothetical protein
MTVGLDDLCETAEDAARSGGHDLGEWTAPPGEESLALVATCRRCGRVAYVRAESSLLGATGPALTESCDGVDLH